MEKDKAIIVRPPLELTSLEELKAQTHQLGEMYKALMQEGTDYGVIPGTDKPTLLKPGAELLRLWTKLAPHFSVNDTGTDLRVGIFAYQITCLLYNQDAYKVCEGVGSCNSLESKYRYRWVWPSELPEGTDKAKMVSKRFKTKKGDFTTKYRLENDNPQDLANTILKMAKKRAFIDAMLTVTGASRIFTQDVEDMVEHEEEELKTISVTKPPAPKPTVAQDAARLDKTIQDKETDRAAQSARAEQDKVALYGLDAVKPPTTIVPPLRNQNPAVSAPPVAVSSAPGPEQAKMMAADKAFGDAIQWFWSEVKKENVDSKDVGKMLGTSLVEWLKAGRTAKQGMEVVRLVILGKKPIEARDEVLLG